MRQSQNLPKLLRASCVILALTTAIAFTVMLSRGAGLRFVSGTWTALAVDASSGMLYRPVLGPIGYGGTRYMPLHFTLHGALMNLTGDALTAGAFLTAAAALGLLTGVYTLLRMLGVARNWALCGAVLSLASLASQLAFTTIRGDLLPAALNIWGLALVARQLDRHAPKVSVPVLLFVLAFSAKVTTLFGLSASVSTFALRGHLKTALRTAVTGAAGLIAVALVILWASEGRVIESMRVCGSGGAGILDILKAPLRFSTFACMDLGFLSFFVAALATVVYSFRTAYRDLATQYFLWTLAATVLIFGSPGIDFNHLLDLHVASVVLLVTRAENAALPRYFRQIFQGAAIVSSVAILAVSAMVLYAFPTPLQHDRRDAFNMATGDTGPVLSEDPWVPIAGGERPFLLDPFNLRLACAKDQRVREDLWAKLEAQYFSGVVLTPVEGPADKEFILDADWMGIPYYGGIHFPPGFIEQLYLFYEPKGRIHSYLVLKPRAKR